MPQVTSTQLQVNQPIEGTAPDTSLVVNQDVARPLAVGSYIFQLEVVDDSGNLSQPVRARINVLDAQAPTAIIRGPASVPFGKGFTLSGSDSVDAGGGKIVRYIWTLIQ